MWPIIATKWAYEVSLGYAQSLWSCDILGGGYGYILISGVDFYPIFLVSI